MIGNHHVCWENQRTKWSFSIVTFVYPEAKAGGNTWFGLKPFGIYSNIELLEANMIINQSTIRLFREMHSQCIGQVANLQWGWVPRVWAVPPLKNYPSPSPAPCSDVVDHTCCN